MKKEKVCEVCGATLKDSNRISYCSKADKVLCNRHRHQFDRLGYFLDDNVKKEDKVCEVCGATKNESPYVCYCSKADMILCCKHRGQFISHGSFTVNEDKVCEVCGKASKESRYVGYCSKANKILCRKHRQQFEKYGMFLDYTAFDRNIIITHDDYAEIELRDKYGNIKAYAKIDIDDVDKCILHKWGLFNNGYAMTSTSDKDISLHRYVMDYYGDKEIDHINRDKLDNRKINLRIVTRSENRVNTGARSNTGYKNITKTPCGTYEVKIGRDGKRLYQKRYNSLTEAVAARDKVISDYNTQNNRAC